MDRKIQNTGKKRRRIILAALALVVPTTLIAWAVVADGGSTVEVNGRELNTATVQRVPFEEMITADGFIVPKRTVIIDAVIGGKIVVKSAEDGALLAEGDTIVMLENTDLKLDILNRETAVLDMMTNIQHTRNLLDQSITNRQTELAEVSYQLTEAKREHGINTKLKVSGAVSESEFLQTQNRVNYLSKRTALIQEAVGRDSLVGRSQIRQMETSLAQARKNLDLMKRKLDDLIVKAPVEGRLSSFDLEVGKLISAGENIAQMDNVDEFKMRVRIDQQYSQKIAIGQPAWAEIGGERFPAVVRKIYPTVTNNQFEADLEFTLEQPTLLKRGQNITARITLSEPRETLVIKKGGFFQSTGGQWVFVIDRSSGKAYRREIRLGKQNPEFYEVAEGLDADEEVIISTYHQFEDYNQLKINQ